MRVILRLKEASQPMFFEGVLNTYTKGPLFCMRMPDGSTEKFPLCSIFSINESGGYSSQKKDEKVK